MTYYGQYYDFPGSWQDNSYREELASKTLGKIDPNEIFKDFYFGLSLQHHDILLQAFYAQYGHRQICHESVFTWSNMVKARVIALADKYDRLFKTIDLIEDPFLTFKEEETEDNTRKGVKKFYSTGLARSDGNAVNQTGETAFNRDERYGDQAGFTHARELEDDKEKGEAKTAEGQNTSSTDYKLMTDTPQTGYPSAVSDGNENVNGDGGNSNGNVFNEGFLTQGDKNTHNERIVKSHHEGSAKNTHRDNERQERQGVNSYDYSQHTSNNAGLVHNTAQELIQNQNTTSEGKSEGEKRKRLRKGFEDESVSSLLTQYRETCIMVTGNYINEFSDLFINIF